tara:strand:- start:64 stop:468 length:405 start_codon:yes stop_codon:yes gene_type:complete
MGDLTKNISKHELLCKCGDCNVTILPEEPIIQIVQEACEHFAVVNNVEKVTLIINRGASCYVYNRSDKIGSNDNSQHPRACAIDFKIFIGKRQVDPKIVHTYLESKYPDSLGLGLYTTFNHADTRPKKARWSKM